MKRLWLSLTLVLTASAVLASGAATSHPNPGKLADAIYQAEGGKKARVPYGVLSIKVRDEAHARQITLNSIRNNWKRWQALDPRPSTLDHDGFIDFMADRWCPKSADPIGKRNWKRNVKLLYAK